MATHQKSNILLNISMSLLILVTFIPAISYASEEQRNEQYDGGIKMEVDIKNVFLEAIRTSVKILSQESSIDEQLEGDTGFYDQASPYYPKRGPINRYIMSHKQEVDVDLLKEDNSNEWTSSYVSLGMAFNASSVSVPFNIKEIETIKLVFKGVYDKETVYINDDGLKAINKFKVARYTYRNKLFLDFLLEDESINKEIYPIIFKQVHIYSI
ncbi:hypothetical protein [Serratia sp. DD3]|uniref:hypothetical protein n=1 Tax=Serratia sp. DD3 TaxID=1410619 RepID=UPI0004D498A6|nr:hypothetical protein [Serratia sp. DD3]KEY60413.1 hypothetical protein SRDD_05710 [Serratia sp. DD3]